MELIDQLDWAVQKVVKNFSPLNSELLNRKPKPSWWSIAPRLDHQIVSNSSYFPTFDRLLRYANLVIASAVTPFCTYSLKQGLQFITVNEQRHINQALTIINHPNFPK